MSLYRLHRQVAGRPCSPHPSFVSCRNQFIELWPHWRCFLLRCRQLGNRIYSFQWVGQSSYYQSCSTCCPCWSSVKRSISQNDHYCADGLVGLQHRPRYLQKSGITWLFYVWRIRKWESWSVSSWGGKSSRWKRPYWKPLVYNNHHWYSRRRSRFPSQHQISPWKSTAMSTECSLSKAKFRSLYKSLGSISSSGRS